MLDFLKDHPFAVEAYFESSTVLTFAVAKELGLQQRIGHRCNVDTHKRALRPLGGRMHRVG